MKKAVEKRNSERGEAGVKLVIILLVIVLVANAGYQFIPVAYAGESLKQDMQKIWSSIASNNIPNDAFVEVKAKNNSITAHVYYIKEVPVLPFGIYNYKYQFDHVATPTGFLTKQD